MEALLKTLRGGRTLDFTFSLWFFLGVGFTLTDWLFSALTDRTGPSIAAAVVGVILIIGQVAIVYGLGSGVIRSAINSDRPTSFRVLATILVAVAMIRLPIVYYGAFASAPLAPVTSVAASEVRTTAPVKVTPARDAKGLTEYQRTLLATLRQHLPAKMDAITVFDTVELEGTRLVQHFEIAGKVKDNADIMEARTSQIDVFCETLLSIHHPGELESLRYSYTFEDGRDLFIDVALSDCGEEAGATPVLPEATAPAKGGGNFITTFEQSTGIDL